ncbi:helix-turn-helix domain-containing protein [Kitasatospora sp. MAA4]|uniref:TetR/AcrR family transcriptional regulator n=1 Tax=Kitasatospora sp. MAA4 TaxID=3035093 RepID=UPI002473F84F|nr:helix-turn-helix domain-containing protein [Kitasatospora sp. MAA4]
MSEDERIEAILLAAYECFRVHGIRRTTMDDIARRAGMSRPAVYQYVRNKEDAFHRLADRLLSAALADVRVALAAEGPLAERLITALGAKLAMILLIYRESPHAEELIGESAQLTADLLADFLAELRAELTAAVQAVLPEDEAAEFAELLLALTRGLEIHSADPEVPMRRLRLGVSLLVRGLPQRDDHH